VFWWSSVFRFRNSDPDHRTLSTVQRTWSLVSLTLAAVVFVGGLAAAVAPAFNALKAPRPLVALSGAGDLTKDVRLACYRISNLPSLNFYSRRNVQCIELESQAHEFLASQVPVYLFLPEAVWQQMEGRLNTPHRLVGGHRDLYGAGRVVVVTNR